MVGWGGGDCAKFCSPSVMNYTSNMLELFLFLETVAGSSSSHKISRHYASRNEMRYYQQGNLGTCVGNWAR